MARTLRVVNYAVNGSGAGHLTRLCAISRWLRRYAEYLGLRLEIYFLTSSEADSLLFHERFASFKLPSKTAVGEAGIDKLAYLALAKQWVWHSLGLLRPDLLVVDTFPSGSFGELLSALDLCRCKVFIHRPVKDDFAGRPDFQSMLPLYDLLLVPEHQATWAVRVPPALRRRTVYTGPVMSRERAELLPREAARQALGVPGEERVVYVSAGGGGDPGAERDLQAVCAALRGPGAPPGLHLVVGAGPLYRGRPLRGPGLTWLTDAGAAELMAGVDVAVCAAGYNTFHELMHAGVPAVFLPQEKVADEQGRRAALAVGAGAGVMLASSGDAPALQAAVAGLLEPAARAAAAAAAQALSPKNHARDAAAALLRLLLSEAEVDAAVAAVDDALLQGMQDTDTPMAAALELLRDLQAAGSAERGGAAEPAQADEEGGAEEELEDEDAQDAGGEESAGAPRGAQLSDGAAAAVLLRQLVACEVPPTTGRQLLRLLTSRLRCGAAAQRAAAIAALLHELRAFADWAGALALVRMLGTERTLLPGALVALLRELLLALRARGLDLYRGVALLSAAQAEDGRRDNAALLRAARGALEAP